MFLPEFTLLSLEVGILYWWDWENCNMNTSKWTIMVVKRVQVQMMMNLVEFSCFCLFDSWWQSWGFQITFCLFLGNLILCESWHCFVYVVCIYLCRYSPNIKEIKVVKHRKVRRARLYYLRNKLPRLSTFKWATPCIWWPGSLLVFTFKLVPWIL